MEAGRCRRHFTLSHDRVNYGQGDQGARWHRELPLLFASALPGDLLQRNPPLSPCSPPAFYRALPLGTASPPASHQQPLEGALPSQPFPSSSSHQRGANRGCPPPRDGSDPRTPQGRGSWKPGSFAALFQAPPSPGDGGCCKCPQLNVLLGGRGGHRPPTPGWGRKAASGDLG